MTTATATRVDWHLGPMLGFDLETTGVDVEQDRVVTAALVYIEPGYHRGNQTYLVDPGIDIPESAAAIHGITTEKARADGQQPTEILPAIVGALADAVKAGVPIVTMNGKYDLTLLDRDCRRNGVEPLSNVVTAITPVIDVLVLDKHLDPFRKGKRNLGALCAHYGVKLDNAHNSAADALAACRLAWVMAKRNPKLRVPLDKLHANQIGWAQSQHAGFANYRRTQGQPLDASETGQWPIKTRETQ